MIDATEKSLDEAGIVEHPEKLLADAGYASEENFAALDEDDPGAYIATVECVDAVLGSGQVEQDRSGGREQPWLRHRPGKPCSEQSGVWSAPLLPF